MVNIHYDPYKNCDFTYLSRFGGITKGVVEYSYFEYEYYDENFKSMTAKYMYLNKVKSTYKKSILMIKSTLGNSYKLDEVLIEEISGGNFPNIKL